MEEKTIRFKNRKGSRIEIIYFEDDGIWITAERKKILSGIGMEKLCQLLRTV